MKIPFGRPRFRASAFAFFALPAAFSVSAQVKLDAVVVTATRTPQPLNKVLADVTVIDAATIERSGATALAEVLARVPGIEFARNGGAGTTTSLFVRGGETRFTAVYVDGVRMDSQSTGGATWEAIPLSQIERIEIVRGPASAVYGSDALAGVVQIFTRKGDGAFSPFVSVGVGSQRTEKLEAGFGGGNAQVDYALSASREISHGFNARPLAGMNPDSDGYWNQSATAKVGWQINAAHRLETSALYSNVNSQYDGSLKKDDRNLHTLGTVGLRWDAQWSAAYRSHLAVTQGRDHYETTPSPYLTDTVVRSYWWQNEYRVQAHLLTAGLERREDYLENASTKPADTRRAQNALALGYGLSSDPHTLQINGRLDDDSEFGKKVTGSAAYAYALDAHWRINASLGTAFRAPTLYQRFSSYGTAALQPESSRASELGLRFEHAATRFGLVAYQNRVNNLINFSTPGPCASSYGCYANTARAVYSGLTLSAAHALDDIHLSGSLDYQNPRDLDTGKLLRRRARVHGNVAADTRVAGWTLGGVLQCAGRRYEDAANTQTLGGYGVLDVYASTLIAKEWTVLARIDNLTDKRYELAQTYATPGRFFFLSLKWAPL